MVPYGSLSHPVFTRLGFAAVFAILLCPLPLTAQSVNPGNQDPLHAWNAGEDPAALEGWVTQRLAASQALVDKMVAVTGPRTVENTLRTYDDAVN